MKGLVRATTLTPLQAVSTEEVALLLGDDDQEKLKKLAMNLEQTIGKLELVAAVASNAEAGQINNMLSLSKICFDEMEGIRVARTQPLYEEQRSINAIFKPAADAFKRISEISKALIRDHVLREQERQALREAEGRRLQEEARKAQQAALEAAARARTQAAGDKAQAALATASTELMAANRQVANVLEIHGVESDWGKSTLRYKPVVGSIDWPKVPREILEQACKEDDAVLRAIAIKSYRNGVMVDGIEVHEEPDVVNRPGFR